VAAYRFLFPLHKRTGGGVVNSTFEAKAIASEYISAFEKILETLDLDAIERLVQRLRKVRDDGGTVYIAGNGGSAATATHWVNDLGKATKRSGQRSMRVMSLADNSSWLTALGNDEGYERVFSGQLENFARAGDVLILISASGNSPNLVDAAECARSHGVAVFALLGFDGGALRTLADDGVWVETDVGEYGLTETAHSLVADIVTTAMMRDVSPT
jgi:D-sedoheptulose 7-phosphate isomerase